MLENLSVCAVIISDDGIRVLDALSILDAFTLESCVADDPVYWDDLVLLWPRHRLDEANAEFLEGLAVRLVDRDEVVESLSDAVAWLAIDLISRRLFTGGEHVKLRLRSEPIDDENAGSAPIILPPWWQLHQSAKSADLWLPRLEPIEVCNPHREVLWGAALFEFLARQMITKVHENESWIAEDWEGKPCGDYELTKAIHREWLMSPHPMLGGGIPRDRLHIAKEWISDLVDSQRFRIHDDESPVPVSTELSSFDTAPFGPHEIVLYFDACRETIASGWRWLMDNPARVNQANVESDLACVMEAFLATWLQTPLEAGPNPAEVIRQERLRIPFIEDGDRHVYDCDCPICEMMQSGIFGPAVLHYDGHQLELDDEFAFSMCATRSEWESQKAEWAEIDASIESERLAKRPPWDEAEHEDSVWEHTYVSGEGIPGDDRGHLQFAFYVAELVSSLQQHGAHQTDVDALNAAFRNYREAAIDEEFSAACTFIESLQSLAERHDYLALRCVDLKNRIEEIITSVPPR